MFFRIEHKTALISSSMPLSKIYFIKTLIGKIDLNLVQHV